MFQTQHIVSNTQFLVNICVFRFIPAIHKNTPALRRKRGCQRAIAQNQKSQNFSVIKPQYML